MTSEESSGPSLPLNVQVGQLFVVQPNPSVPVREGLAEHLENYFGGFFLRPENLPSVHEARELTRRLRRHWRRLPPPIVAVDEEGGFVADLGHLTTPAPAAAALGALDDPDVTRDVYEGIGRKLRALGFNTSFAPVLDIHSEPRNPVIGMRAFGGTARAVAKHGLAAVKGFRAAGIAACVKHFPGHGATVLDSHETLPVVDADRNLLTDRELAPFAEVFEHAAPDMLMAAHVAYPGLGEAKRPASLSRAILRDLLRGEMGYKGVVITDAMEMKGISALLSPEKAAVEALLAGADLLLYAHDRGMAAAAYRGVLAAVEQGVLPMDRVEESLERIMRLRRTFQAHSWYKDEEAAEALSISEDGLFFDAALRCITVEGNAGVLNEISSNAGPKLAVIPAEVSAGRRIEVDVVREQLQPAGFNVMATSAEPTGEQIDQAEKWAAEAQVVVVATASRGPMSQASERLVQAVTRRDVIKVGIALLNPDDADRMMTANCRLKTYGTAVPQLWAACQKLLG